MYPRPSDQLILKLQKILLGQKHVVHRTKLIQFCLYHHHHYHHRNHHYYYYQLLLTRPVLYFI